MLIVRYTGPQPRSAKRLSKLAMGGALRTIQPSSSHGPIPARASPRLGSPTMNPGRQEAPEGAVLAAPTGTRHLQRPGGARPIHRSLGSPRVVSRPPRAAPVSKAATIGAGACTLRRKRMATTMPRTTATNPKVKPVRDSVEEKVSSVSREGTSVLWTMQESGPSKYDSCRICGRVKHR